MPYADPDRRVAYMRGYARTYERAPRKTGRYHFPLERICLQCQKTFVLRERPSPSGPLPSFCSRECIRERRRANDRGYGRLRKYELTAAEYDAMLSAQGECCAACGVPFADEARTTPYVDHDHETGAVRGLLCNGCNIALGKWEKRGPALERYVAAATLDLRELCQR